MIARAGRLLVPREKLKSYGKKEEGKEEVEAPLVLRPID
jgi:hypothetical protein